MKRSLEINENKRVRAKFFIAASNRVEVHEWIQKGMPRDEGREIFEQAEMVDFIETMTDDERAWIIGNRKDCKRMFQSRVQRRRVVVNFEDFGSHELTKIIKSAPCFSAINDPDYVTDSECLLAVEDAYVLAQTSFANPDFWEWGKVIAELRIFSTSKKEFLDKLGQTFCYILSGIVINNVAECLAFRDKQKEELECLAKRKANRPADLLSLSTLATAGRSCSAKWIDKMKRLTIDDEKRRKILDELIDVNISLDKVDYNNRQQVKDPIREISTRKDFKCIVGAQVESLFQITYLTLKKELEANGRFDEMALEAMEARVKTGTITFFKVNKVPSDLFPKMLKAIAEFGFMSNQLLMPGCDDVCCFYKFIMDYCLGRVKETFFLTWFTQGPKSVEQVCTALNIPVDETRIWNLCHVSDYYRRTENRHCIVNKFFYPIPVHLDSSKRHSFVIADDESFKATMLEMSSVERNLDLVFDEIRYCCFYTDCADVDNKIIFHMRSKREWNKSFTNYEEKVLTQKKNKYESNWLVDELLEPTVFQLKERVTLNIKAGVYVYVLLPFDSIDLRARLTCGLPSAYFNVFTWPVM